MKMKDGEELRLSLSLRTSEQSPSGVARPRERSPQGRRCASAAEWARERSDEEDCGGGRKKLRLSKVQAGTLEDAFRRHHTLSPKEKLALAEELSLTPRQVEVWFQNRRARKKLKKTEVDREMLKRCCDSLSEENRRLRKELMDLRALNKRPPHGLCFPVPPPTSPPTPLLTICPSCNRATTIGVTTSDQIDCHHASTAASPAFHSRHISPVRRVVSWNR